MLDNAPSATADGGKDGEFLTEDSRFAPTVPGDIGTLVASGN